MTPCFQITVSILWILTTTLNAQTTNPPSSSTTVMEIKESDSAMPNFWVLCMIIFSFLGIMIIPSMCIHSLYHFHKDNLVKTPLRILYAIFFVAYLSTCIAYGFFRTDLILPMGTSIPCTFGYYFTTNSVYLAKIMLWSVFMYRIDLAFHSSAMGYPRSVLLCILITLIAISTGLNMLFIYVTKDIIIFLDSPHFNGAISGMCTFSSENHHGLFTITMGLLFLFDMVANITLCALFTHKLRIVIRMGADCSGHDRKLQKLMRKQTTLVLVICITSMAVLAVGAMVYGLSLIMPLDALVNAFCIWLMFSFSDPIWNKITHCCCYCCYCDCCGHKEDFMMTLHSMRSIRGSSLQQEAISSTRSPSVQRSTRPQRVVDDEAPPPISERVSEKQTDIEIKFKNDITPDDLKKKPA